MSPLNFLFNYIISFDLLAFPLHLAAQKGHLNVFEKLLEKEARVDGHQNHLNSLDMAIDNGHK